MASNELVERLKVFVAPWAHRHGIDLVVLYGSMALGEDALESDIDLAIWRCGRLGGGERIDLVAELPERFEGRALDYSFPLPYAPVLAFAVARDGIPLYERQSGEFDRFWSLASRIYADTEKFRRARDSWLGEVARDFDPGTADSQ